MRSWRKKRRCRQARDRWGVGPIGEVTEASAGSSGGGPAFSEAEIEETMTFSEAEVEEAILREARRGARSKKSQKSCD